MRTVLNHKFWAFLSDSMRKWRPVRPEAALDGARFVIPNQSLTSAVGDSQSSTSSLTGQGSGFPLRTLVWILVGAASYYLATQLAWSLTFPESDVSLFFPPHAIMVSILLLVPARQWWAFILAAAASHLIATQQAGWPPLLALQSEAFDAVKYVLTAAGIRLFAKSPFHFISLREAILFVLIAVIVVPFVLAFWGAADTARDASATSYWTEWLMLGISNGVTTIVMVPVILIGVHWLSRKKPIVWRRLPEAVCIAAGILFVGWLSFVRLSTGLGSSPALLYSSIPLLIWAALRFGPGGACASMLLVTTTAIWGTMHGHGPFLAQSPTQNAIALQLFLMFAAGPLLLLAVAIEDERRSTAAMRISEERMNLTAESAQLAMWDWDLTTGKVLIQDGGRFGFDPDSAIDHNTLSGRVHPDDLAVRAKAIQTALENGGSYECEFRAIQPDGSIRWIAARGHKAHFADSDATPRILGVAWDITAQKQAAAEAQQQREELAHLSRAATLSALSSSLAHELSQPLTSILSNAQAGQRFIDREPPDYRELPGILEDIVNEDLRAGEIIDRLRTLLRRGQIALRAVSVQETLDELLRLTRNDFIGRQVSVHNLAAGNLPPAMTDRVQLQQVLLNLILNACDAMESNAHVDRQLTLTAEVVKDELRIGVLDCGIGLPDDIESMFQPFHTTKPHGLGMGLSICRTLISSQGGRLWAERRTDGGAAFYVSLPLASS
jgi:PAS domain S-box-containing protein